MSLTVEVNGTAIVDAIPPSTIQATQRADDGDVGFGGFAIDDPDALIATTGHHMVTVEESACSQPRLFTGYLTERSIARSLERGMIAGDDARAHDVTAVDLNAVFAFRTLTYSAVKRPDETMADRLTWLLGHWSLAAFIEDTGHVTYPTLTMDAADYTGSTAKAVLDDMVGRTGETYTYFAFWDATAGKVGLYFGPEGTGIGQSSLYISNDLADLDDAVTFAPDAEAKLARTPEEVYSEVIVEYSHGTKRVYRSRPATVAAYDIARGTTIQRPYTGRETTAQAQADTWLTKHAVETDTITVAIIVPPASAGLAVAGQRINVKFTHLDGYTDWTSMRIVTSTISPVTDVANVYRVELVLVLPKAGSSPPASCDGSVNPLAGLTATKGATNLTGTFDPEGEDITNPDAATDGVLQENLNDTAHFKETVWSGWHTRIREFEFTLPAESSVRRVTVRADLNSEGLEPREAGLYVKVGGTSYAASSYATYDDADVWGWTTGHGQLATWDFGADIPTTSIVLGHTEYAQDLVVPFYLTEIAACLSDADETADLGASQTAPIIATADPTANDDANDGYQVGQTWVNTTTGAVFTLTDATPGAAVWTPSGGTTGTDLGWFVVTEYGAVGDDSTDDTAAIQSAIDAAEAAGGGIVYFPGLTFKITSSLICNTAAANVQFLGAGNQYGPSVIHMTATDSALEFPDDFNTHDTQAPLVRNLRIKGPTTTTAGVYGIYAYADCHLENVGIDGFYQGFRLGSHSYYSRVKGCMFSNNYDSGVYLYGGNNAVIESSRFIGGSTGPTPYGYGAQSHGIVILGSLNTRVVNNSIEQYGSIGILVEGSGPTNDPWGSLATVITGNYFETSVTGALAAIYLGYADPVASVLIEGNYIQGGTVSGCWSIDANYAAHATIIGNDIGFTAANNNTHGAIRGGANASDFLLLNNRVYSGTVTLPTDSYTLNPDTPPLTSGDAAGGDLGGTYPNPDVTAIDGVAVSGTPAAGDVLTATGAAAATWRTPSSGSGVGPLLIEDTPAGSPLVFADLLQNEEGTDLLYADTV